MSNNLQDTIAKIMSTKDSNYYLTTPIRLTTIHWCVSSQRISNLPISNIEETINFVLKCKNADSFFGFNIGFPSSLLATLNALQIFYSVGYFYYDEAILHGLKNFMNEDGSFFNDVCGEIDNRFLVSAVSILNFMYNVKQEKLENTLSEFYSEKLGFTRKNYFTGKSLYSHIDIPKLGNSVPNDFINLYLDRDKIIKYIFECENKDGGFGSIPMSESHGANTFCCVSALCSLNALDLVDIEALSRFLVFRQTPSGGFNGRVNKNEDLCYSFWVYSTLYILGKVKLIDQKKLTEFIENCFDERSGMYADKPNNEPDLYHTLYALLALSLLGDIKLNIVDPCLGI